MDEQSLNNLGCVSPIRTNKYHTSPRCLLNETVNKIYQEYKDRTLNKPICKLGCSFMSVIFDRSDVSENSIKGNGSFAKLYIKNNVKVSQSIIDYSAISLMAEVGGYLGLLLGTSLFDITYLIDVIIDILQ